MQLNCITISYAASPVVVHSFCNYRLFRDCSTAAGNMRSRSCGVAADENAGGMESSERRQYGRRTRCEYVADAAEGIVRVEDLPLPKVFRRCRSFKRRRCPECGHMAYRDKVFTRRLRELWEIAAADRPRELLVSYSQHCCSHCQELYFNVDLSDLAVAQQPLHPSVVRYFCAVRWSWRTACRTVRRPGISVAHDHWVFVPFATLQNWVEAGEKGPPNASPAITWTDAGQLLGLHRRR